MCLSVSSQGTQGPSGSPGAKGVGGEPVSSLKVKYSGVFPLSLAQLPPIRASGCLFEFLQSPPVRETSGLGESSSSKREVPFDCRLCLLESGGVHDIVPFLSSPDSVEPELPATVFKSSCLVAGVWHALTECGFVL